MSVWYISKQLPLWNGSLDIEQVYLVYLLLLSVGYTQHVFWRYFFFLMQQLLSVYVVWCYQEVLNVCLFWENEVIWAVCTSLSSWVPLSLLLSLLCLLALLCIDLLLGLSAHPWCHVCHCLLLLLAFLPIDLLLELSAYPLHPECHCLQFLLTFSPVSCHFKKKFLVVYCTVRIFGLLQYQWVEQGKHFISHSITFLLHVTVFLKKNSSAEVLVCSVSSIYSLFSDTGWLIVPFPISLLCVVHCSIVTSAHAHHTKFFFQRWNNTLLL